MDKGFGQAVGQLGRGWHLPLVVAEAIPTGYAPLVLACMGFKVSVVHNTNYAPPFLVRLLLDCRTPVGVEPGLGIRFVGDACSLTRFRIRPQDDFVVLILQR